MAKTSSSKGRQGKPKPARGKSVVRRAAAQSARARSQQKSQQKSRSGRPAEKRGLVKFIRDVRTEMGKVTWPTRKELMQSTLVVLVAVAIATVYTGVLDFIFSKVVDTVVNVLT